MNSKQRLSKWAVSRRLLSPIVFFGSLLPSYANAGSPTYTEYCFDLIFRETPYTDIKCASRTRFEDIGAAKHFELEYDSAGRLTEVRYVQNGELRPYSARFVKAAKTKFSYSDGVESRKFFNEYGHRTTVSGDVYETRIDVASNGDRLSLAFYDVEGQPTENDFAIARYGWRTQNDGDVVETRWRLDGSVQRNRPGFGYYVTRFSYDARGLLRRMTNLGVTGEHVSADNAGVIATQIGYDQNNRFTQWLNLGGDELPRRGMSEIAEIRYKPSPFAGEQVALFIDADGAPQSTRWGAHKVRYEFDEFGNETLRQFFGTDGEPISTANGVGQIESVWDADGATRNSRSYFNTEMAPVGVTSAEIHSYLTELDSSGRPTKTKSFSLSGELVSDPDTGYAVDETVFDDAGRIIERRFLDKNGALTNHAEWGIARFIFTYNANDELQSVTTLTDAGAKKKPAWNPAH